jgi:hypothetical protein
MDLTCSPSCGAFDDAELLGDCCFSISGDFDLRVDFSSFSPVIGSNQDIAAGLSLTIGSNTYDLTRVSCTFGTCNGATGNRFTVFQNGRGGSLLFNGPADVNTSGTLRITRSGNTVTFISSTNTGTATIGSLTESTTFATIGLFLERRFGGTWPGHVEWDDVRLVTGSCVGC